MKGGRSGQLRGQAVGAAAAWELPGEQGGPLPLPPPTPPVPTHPSPGAGRAEAPPAPRAALESHPVTDENHNTDVSTARGRGLALRVLGSHWPDRRACARTHTLTHSLLSPEGTAGWSGEGRGGGETSSAPWDTLGHTRRASKPRREARGGRAGAAARGSLRRAISWRRAGAGSGGPPRCCGPQPRTRRDTAQSSRSRGPGGENQRVSVRGRGLRHPHSWTAAKWGLPASSRKPRSAPAAPLPPDRSPRPLRRPAPCEARPPPAECPGSPLRTGLRG